MTRRINGLNNIIWELVVDVIAVAELRWKTILDQVSVDLDVVEEDVRGGRGSACLVKLVLLLLIVVVVIIWLNLREELWWRWYRWWNHNERLWLHVITEYWLLMLLLLLLLWLLSWLLLLRLKLGSIQEGWLLWRIEEFVWRKSLIGNDWWTHVQILLLLLLLLWHLLLLLNILNFFCWYAYLASHAAHVNDGLTVNNGLAVAIGRLLADLGAECREIVLALAGLVMLGREVLVAL
jgi:hypothetical protein